jgi:hypothetical protein
MALVLELTAASSNLAGYLASYDTNFTYNGNGWYSSSFTGQDQWSAGFDTEGTDNNLPSVVMNINDYTYSPGAFNGDVESITLGKNLEYDAGQDLWIQDEELIITNSTGYIPDNSTFSQAIYSLSHGGQVDGGVFFGTQFAGLTDFFAEQGTIQIGNLGLSDTLTGFGGDDTFVFQDGSGTDTVNNFGLADDILDVSAWGATGLGDLVIAEFGGSTFVFSSDLTDGITVAGVTGLTLANFEFA